MEWIGTNNTVFGTVLQMFGACIDNLRLHALDVEIQDMPEYLSEEQKAFLLNSAKVCT